jgi:anti-sigma B factor antagonist
MDLAECPYMDSAGLGLVINQYVAAEKDARKFLVTGLNDQIRTLMTVTRMTTVLPVFGTVDEAEGSL